MVRFFSLLLVVTSNGYQNHPPPQISARGSLLIPRNHSISPISPTSASRAPKPSYHVYPYPRSTFIAQNTLTSTRPEGLPWNGGWYHPELTELPPGWTEPGRFPPLVRSSPIIFLYRLRSLVPDAHADHLSRLLAKNSLHRPCNRTITPLRRTRALRLVSRSNRCPSTQMAYITFFLALSRVCAPLLA